MLSNDENVEVEMELAKVEDGLEALSEKSYANKQDIIEEIAIRIFSPEHEKLLDRIVREMMKKENVAMTMEKYAEKNFGSLITHFPDLQQVNQTLSREKLKQQRKDRRRRRK
jgi:hypothetical protein